MGGNHVVSNQRIVNEKKPKVLVVGYYWYPFAGVGTYRVSRFVKYLQRLGWDVAILTAKKAATGHIADPDDPLLKSVKVYRSSFLNQPNYSQIKNLATQVAHMILQYSPKIKEY